MLLQAGTWFLRIRCEPVTLRAVWTMADDSPPWLPYLLWVARCGMPRCRAHLGFRFRLDDSPTVPTSGHVILHPGLVWEPTRELYCLSRRAEKEWERAQAQGERWNVWLPRLSVREAHGRTCYQRERVEVANLQYTRASGMPGEYVAMPCRVACPLCGFVTAI
jgi:hypothetical protein